MNFTHPIGQKFPRLALAAALALPMAAQVAWAQPAPAPAPGGTAAPAPAGLPPLLPSSATQPTSRPVAPTDVVIRVGDEAITVAEFEGFISDLPPRDQAMARGEGRRELAEYLVKMKLLAAEARRRNLQNDPGVKRRATVAQDQILAGALVQAAQNEKMDDAAVKKFFDENRAKLERVAARHVLIRTPGSRVPAEPGKPELTEEQAKAKADDVYKRLTTGKEDFAKVAKEASDDVGSGAEGGDLGSFTRDKMVAPFSAAAFALKEGEISQPVKSAFGWHIIQLTGRFDTPEKLGDQIREQVGPERMNAMIRELRKNAKVELDENYLGPALPEGQGE